MEQVFPTTKGSWETTGGPSSSWNLAPWFQDNSFMPSYSVVPAEAQRQGYQAGFQAVGNV